MNLASVQRVTKLTPIEGANYIETATILGWEVVVKKGEFIEGELCIYVQIDSIMPDNPAFEFLRDRKFRVRTIKLRNQLSQGLALPLKTVMAVGMTLPATKEFMKRAKEGLDVTQLLGVKKYEKVDSNPKFVKPKAPKSGYKKWIYMFKYNFLYKYFPSLLKENRTPFPKDLVPITDEERIQNMPSVLEKYKGKRFILSYKLDGSSITIIHSKVFGKSKYRICSRRFELHDKRNDWYKVFKDTEFDYQIEKLVKVFGSNNIIVQGEAIGKFNGNHHNLPTEQIRLFNIFVNGHRINQAEFVEVCTRYGIPHCPVYKTVTMNHTLPEVLAMSDLKDCLNPNVPAEGLVWRCVDEPLSFKVINNKFLIKKGE